MMVAESRWIPPLLFNICHTLSDHRLGYLSVVGPLFLLPFAFQTNRLIVINRQNPLILWMQIPIASRACEGAG